MGQGAVGAVLRWSVTPGMSVARFSSEPMNEAILRASSLRSSRALSTVGEPCLLVFVTVSFICPMAKIAGQDPEALMFFRVQRGIGNKSEGSGYRVHSV